MNLDTQSLMQISLFEKITKAKVKDCFEDSNKQLTFCVESGELFKAIGKDAKMIKKIDNLFKRKIRIIEFDATVAKFVKNLCHPNKVVRVVKVNESLWDDKKEVVVITPADTKSRGYLIGKAGANLRNMEGVVARYFKLSEIKVGAVEEIVKKGVIPKPTNAVEAKLQETEEELKFEEVKLGLAAAPKLVETETVEAPKKEVNEEVKETPVEATPKVETPGTENQAQ